MIPSHFTLGFSALVWHIRVCHQQLEHRPSCFKQEEHISIYYLLCLLLGRLRIKSAPTCLLFPKLPIWPLASYKWRVSFLWELHSSQTQTSTGALIRDLPYCDVNGANSSTLSGGKGEHWQSDCVNLAAFQSAVFWIFIAKELNMWSVSTRMCHSRL